MKKVFVFGIIILLIFNYIIYPSYYKYKQEHAEYTDSVYVKTKWVNYNKRGVNYYELNQIGNIRIKF